MATVLKQPGSKFWIAAFRDATGKQHRRSTGEVLKSRALEVAKQFERVGRGKGNRHRVRNTFADFYREHFGIDLPFSSLRTYCQNWLVPRKVETSIATYARYERTLKRFLEFLGDDAEKDLNEITPAKITAFRDSRLKEASTRTSNLELKIIKMVFRAARLEGHLWQDPAERIKTVKNRDPFLRRPFTIDELRSILAVADPEWQSLIKFGLYTGQRLSDLASLTWSQIDLERNEIRLHTRKTGKSLLIPIAQPLHEHLLTLSSGDNPKGSGVFHCLHTNDLFGKIQGHRPELHCFLVNVWRCQTNEMDHCRDMCTTARNFYSFSVGRIHFPALGIAFHWNAILTHCEIAKVLADIVPRPLRKSYMRLHHVRENLLISFNRFDNEQMIPSTIQLRIDG